MKKGWTYKKFSDAFHLQMGKTPSRDNPTYWGGDNSWVSIADLKGKYVSTTKEKITDKAIDESGIFMVPKGTVIMSFKLTIGRTAIASEDLYTNEAIMSFVPITNDTILADYLYYYLQGYKWSGANKAVMGHTLNKKTISGNIIAYPPLEEQHQIVSELDKLNLIIEKKKQQVKELDKLAQSIFYDMFGDPVENEMCWDCVPFNTVCKGMTKGPFGSDIKKSLFVPKSNDTIKVYIQINAIQKNENLGDYYITQEYFERKMTRFEVFPQDYIITCDGTLGKCLRLSESMERGIISASLLKLTLNEKIIPYYFESLWANYLLSKLVNQTRNAALIHLPSAKVIGNELIPLPPLNLQQSFAAKVEAIERQKDLINQSIREAQTLFDSRMEYYFGE